MLASLSWFGLSGKMTHQLLNPHLITLKQPSSDAVMSMRGAPWLREAEHLVAAVVSVR
jgi:hypothetical protein